MSDPRRLRMTGSEEERRLLRAAAALPVPQRVQQQVFAALEQRRDPAPRPRWRRRVAFGLAGALLAGTAAAASLGSFDAWWQHLRGDAPLGDRELPAQPAAVPPTSAVAVPPAAPAPPEPAAPAPPEAYGQRRTACASRPHHPHAWRPSRPRGPSNGRGSTCPASCTPDAPPAKPLRRRRPDSCCWRAAIAPTSCSTVRSDGVRGAVRGQPLDLTIKGKSISGRIGEDAVLINVLGDGAQGSVGGRPIGFMLHPNRTRLARQCVASRCGSAGWISTQRG